MKLRNGDIMGEVITELFNIILENNIKLIKRYLKKNKISFKKTKTNILFEIGIDENKIEWNILYKKNYISKAVCNCDSSLRSYSEFIHFLSDNFVYMYKNPITNIEYYEGKTNKKILLNIDNKGTLNINILVIKQGKSKRKIYKTDLVEILKMIGFALLGVGFSTCEYILYNCLKLVWLNILMAIFSVLYMMFSCYIISRLSYCERKKSSIISIVLPIVYWLIVFVALIILNNANIPDISTRLVVCTYWAFYAMPAFILLISLLVLLFLGAGYA
jgi:hypothetical protein